MDNRILSLYYTWVYYILRRRNGWRTLQKTRPNFWVASGGFGDRWKLSSALSTVSTNVPACLQLMAACRGALNGLMAEVLEGHIRFHVLDPKSGKNAPQVEAAEELIDVVRTYLK